METKEVYNFLFNEVIYDDDGSLLDNPYLLFDGFRYSLTKAKPSSNEAAVLCSNLQDLKVNNLLANYVLPKVWNITAFQSENDSLVLADGSNNPDWIDWAYRVAAYLNSSFPYFSKLIDLYTAQEANLLSQVKSTSHGVNKVNDLPQTEFVSTDDHLTSLADQQNDSASDFDTPMARLDEVRRKLDNTYQRWADEFIEKFAIM